MGRFWKPGNNFQITWKDALALPLHGCCGLETTRRESLKEIQANKEWKFCNKCFSRSANPHWPMKIYVIGF